MHMGDICAWSSPADPHQLQSAFRPGGPRMQVSCAASLSSGVRKRTHPEVHSKKKTTSDFSIFQKWVNDRMELQKKQTFWVIFPFFFVVLNLWNRTMIPLFIFDSHQHMRSLVWAWSCGGSPSCIARETTPSSVCRLPRCSRLSLSTTKRSGKASPLPIEFGECHFGDQNVTPCSQTGLSCCCRGNCGRSVSPKS